MVSSDEARTVLKIDGFLFCIIMLLVLQKRSGMSTYPASEVNQKLMSFAHLDRLRCTPAATMMVSTASSSKMMESKVFLSTPSKPRSSPTRCLFNKKLEPVIMAAPAGLWFHPMVGIGGSLEVPFQH